jgi:sugar lactone lactonase YvrE
MIRKTFTGIALVVSVLLFSGCAMQSTTSTEKEQKIQLQWPEPPETPRFIYETELRSEADIRPETEDERLRKMLTGRLSVSESLVYRKPAALAARKGRIYVADPPTNAIVVFDITRGRTYQIGVREPNRITKPVSLAIDGQDNVYVLDSMLRKVMVYDALGLFMYSVGDPKAFTQPAGVAVSHDGKKIFVVDRGSVEGNDHKVIAYSPDGTELFRIGPRGAGPGQLNIPLAASVTPDGTLLVLDSGNFRIQAFDLDGKHRFSFGSVGNGLGQFSRARSIATDDEGKIFVSDASFNNVQIFNPAGELLMWIGSSGMRNVPGQFGLIAGIAVDETGRLYVADHYHIKIEVYRPANIKSRTPAH